MSRQASIPTYLLPSTAIQSRLSSVLLAAGTTFPFDTSISHSYPVPGQILLKATGLTADLAVDIEGTNNGSQLETITIPSAGSQMARSTKLWQTVTRLKVTASQAGSIEILATDVGGSPVQASTVVNSALRVRLSIRRLTDVGIDPQGTQISERFILYTNSTDVQIGDEFVVDGVTYAAEHAPQLKGSSKTAHHTEVYLRRIS